MSRQYFCGKIRNTNLFQITISGAIFIIFVVVIRSVAINRLPKKTFIILWNIAEAIPLQRHFELVRKFGILDDNANRITKNNRQEVLRQQSKL